MIIHKTRVSNIYSSKLNVFNKDSGKLSVIQSGNEIKWKIERVFFISVTDPEIRGDHAHHESQQAFVCTAGQVDLELSDGTEEKIFQLFPLEEVVVVPPGIWVTIKMSSMSSLTVLTDQPYDDSDYIHDWEIFRKLKEMK